MVILGPNYLADQQAFNMKLWDIATILVSWINMVSLSFVGGMDAAHECLKSVFEALKNNTENEFNLSKCFECWL